MQINTLKSKLRRSALAWIVPVVAGLLTVNGCNKVDEAAEEAFKEYVFDGEYFHSGVVFDVDGNEATITSFGDNKIGTNSSVLKVGDPYLKNIEKVGPNKYEADVVHTDVGFKAGTADWELKSITYEHTNIDVKENGIFMDNGDGLMLSWTKSTGGSGGGGNGGGGNGGGGTGGECYQGTWYSNACGDPKGVIWTLNKDMTGSFSNKDCNGICTPIVFTFKYTVSGNTINVSYDATQPIVKCDGYEDSRPPKPKDGSFTFTCSGDKLTVNSGNGPNTFTR